MLRKLGFSLVRAVAVVGGLMVAVSCNDDHQPTAVGPAARVIPAASALRVGPALPLGSTDVIPVVAMSFPTPLAPGLRGAAVIGPEGGEFGIPAAGLRVVVPRGAVRERTAFSVTLLDSTTAAYEFEPSGAKFHVPLEVTQKLGALAPPGMIGMLTVGYFTDPAQWEKEDAGKPSKKGKKGHVSELLPVTLHPRDRSLTFLVSHFSGYVVAQRSYSGYIIAY